MSDIHALSGAYAVDALDDVERARFERHLSDCDACRTEVDDLREAATMLTVPVATAAPAPLRDRVLAEIRHVRPLPPVVTVEPVRSRSWVPLLLTAAAVALLGLVLGVTRPWAADTEPQPISAQQVLDDPQADVVTLTFDDGSQATVTRSTAHGRAVIQTTDMAPAPDGKVYEVWLQDDAGAMVPAGLMEEGGDLTLLLDGDAAAATGVGITVEPTGGSPEPTSEPIALFAFDSA